MVSNPGTHQKTPRCWAWSCSSYPIRRLPTHKLAVTRHPFSLWSMTPERYSKGKTTPFHILLQWFCLQNSKSILITISFFQCTNEVQWRHPNIKFSKYADDMAIVGLLNHTKPDDFHFQTIYDFSTWCKDCNLILNMDKSKEMINHWFLQNFHSWITCFY